MTIEERLANLERELARTKRPNRWVLARLSALSEALVRTANAGIMEHAARACRELHHLIGCRVL